MINEKNNQINYKEAYEAEHKRCTDLSRKIADLEAANEDLTYKLNRIYNNKFFKFTKPFRRFAHFLLRQWRRLRNCGNIKDVIAKIKKKRKERQIQERYGTKSFPSVEEAERQKNTVFDRNVKISILVPLYNTPKDFLKEMIDSVVNQTYQNWEMIIVDDRSQDNTREIVEEYMKNDPRIQYHLLDVNSGAAVARTTAMKLAKGSYMAFLDSDDIWTPDKLERQIHWMNDNGYAFSCTAYEQIDEEDVSLHRVIKTVKKTDYNRLLLDCPVGNSTVVYDVEKMGKFEVPNIRKRNDDALWLQMLKKEKYT